MLYCVLLCYAYLILRLGELPGLGSDDAAARLARRAFVHPWRRHRTEFGPQKWQEYQVYNRNVPTEHTPLWSVTIVTYYCYLLLLPYSTRLSGVSRRSTKLQTCDSPLEPEVHPFHCFTPFHTLCFVSVRCILSMPLEGRSRVRRSTRRNRSAHCALARNSRVC